MLDLGAGAQGLRELVDHYTPADLSPRTPDSLPFDMERDIYPEGSWDVAVLSGVLEYATSPGKVLSKVRPLAPTLILSYQTVTRPTLERAKADFRNHLDPSQLERLCRLAGFKPELVDHWQRQSIYRLT